LERQSLWSGQFYIGGGYGAGVPILELARRATVYDRHAFTWSSTFPDTLFWLTLLLLLFLIATALGLTIPIGSTILAWVSPKSEGKRIVSDIIGVSLSGGEQK
jgi:hypothetical protein